MKKILTLLIGVVFLSCGDSAPEGYTVIKGTLKEVSDTTLYVSYVDDKGYQSDQVEVKDGKFEWSKPLNFPTTVSFSLSNRMMYQSEGIASMWTEPGALKLTLYADDMKGYILKGSSVNTQVQAFEKTFEKEMERLRELSPKLQSADTPEDEKSRLREEYQSVMEVLTGKRLEYVKEHPDSYYSAYMLFNSKHGMSPEETSEYLDILTGAAAESQYVRRIKQEIGGELSGRVGNKAPLFSGTDINGDQFDLASLIGKNTIIIDFWASWCVPCRAGNPHLKDLHNKYREDGLAVICVADNDSSPDEWRKAVATDEIEQFIHVLRGWGGMEEFFDLTNDKSSKYGIHTLPTKFIIDKSGIIVGRYGGGGEPHDALDGKLIELFGF